MTENDAQKLIPTVRNDFRTFESCAGKQASRQTDRQMGRPTDRQTERDRETDRQARQRAGWLARKTKNNKMRRDRLSCQCDGVRREANRQRKEGEQPTTNSYTHKEANRPTERYRETDRQTHRQTSERGLKALQEKRVTNRGTDRNTSAEYDTYE